MGLMPPYPRCVTNRRPEGAPPRRSTDRKFDTEDNILGENEKRIYIRYIGIGALLVGCPPYIHGKWVILSIYRSSQILTELRRLITIKCERCIFVLVII